MKKGIIIKFYELKAHIEEQEKRRQNNSANEKNFNDYYNFENSSNSSMNKTPWVRQQSPDEEIFGVLLLICGLAAAIANALILIIAIKHLRSRNVLFIIITNFALIDEFKALCAIYMGAAQLMSSTSYLLKIDQQASIYKMLQTSVFIFYFGNICSVLNLVLAVTNEFLFIKLPLQYSKFVKKRRVVMAVLFIWLAGLAFSLSKALHGGSNETGAQVWISSSNSASKSDNETILTSPLSERTNQTPTNTKSVYRRQNGSVATDIYALILVSVLLFCLFIVGAIYLSLYKTIRKATSFSTKESLRSRASNCSMTTDQQKNSYSPVKSTLGKKRNRQKTQLSKRFLNRTSVESFFRPTTLSSSNDNQHQHIEKGMDDVYNNVETMMTDNTTSTGIMCTESHTRNNSSRSTASSVKTTISASNNNSNTMITTVLPSHCKHRRRDSRLFRRHKCIIVILSVCCLYLVYLSCYFSLQLFHIIHILQGVEQTKLRERYIINFVLRALFVLHASLNPLIFFRIQTFRYSFIQFCNSNILYCCKVSIGGKTVATRSGQSFADVSAPITEY